MGDCMERKELLTALSINYLNEKENDRAWQRERSTSHVMALGKLQGACMALNLDFEESNKGICIVTQIRRKVITTIEK